jgi:hypothetical protein
MCAISRQNQTVENSDITNTLSGYLCPFSKEDCLHIDSLSMTKTVSCTHCENFIQTKVTKNSVHILSRILTNIY